MRSRSLSDAPVDQGPRTRGRTKNLARRTKDARYSGMKCGLAGPKTKVPARTIARRHRKGYQIAPVRRRRLVLTATSATTSGRACTSVAASSTTTALRLDVLGDLLATRHRFRAPLLFRARTGDQVGHRVIQIGRASCRERV